MYTKKFYTDVAMDKDRIVYWVREDDGSLTTLDVKTEDYSYCFIPANDGVEYPYRDLFGNMAKPVWFKNGYELSKFGESHPNSMEADVNPKTRFMIDEFHDADLESPYKLAFYDIEVDFDLSDGRGYPIPENPFGEINSIQIFDCDLQTYVMLIPEHKARKIELKDAEYPVDVIPCVNEMDMLRTFAAYLQEVDIIGGWYTNGFDLPYIMARAIRLFGESAASTMFCRDGFKIKKREYIDENAQEKVEWTLVGIQHVDMLELYKKFNPGEKPSFSLDAICEHEKVGKKVEYSGDLGRLYREDPQKFYEYAIHDVRLLKDLDAKTDIIKLAVTMSRESCVNISDVTGTVKPIENAFIKFCREKGNIVLPNKKHHEKEKFPGAIVYDTLSGVHKWMASFDITSLYPSVMIMLGLSTETLVMQILEEYDGFVAVMTESDDMVTVRVEDGANEVIEVRARDLHDIIRENGYTISANGTIFNGELGLLSEFVKSIFDKRVMQKNKSKEYFKAGDDANGKRFDLFQKVTKIYANSLYGCIGNTHFRLFDLRMAKSITMTGQVISKQQVKAANDLLEVA